MHAGSEGTGENQAYRHYQPPSGSGGCSDRCLVCPAHRELVYADGFGDPKERPCVHEAVVATTGASIGILPGIRSEALRLVGAKPIDHVLTLGPPRLVTRIVDF